MSSFAHPLVTKGERPLVGFLRFGGGTAFECVLMYARLFYYNGKCGVCQGLAKNISGNFVAHDFEKTRASA